jgi:hypothetical protein
MGRRTKHIGCWLETHRKIHNWEDQDIGGGIILRWILKRWDGVAWTGLIWLRIGTGGGLL